MVSKRRIVAVVIEAKGKITQARQRSEWREGQAGCKWKLQHERVHRRWFQPMASTMRLDAAASAWPSISPGQ